MRLLIKNNSIPTYKQEAFCLFSLDFGLVLSVMPQGAGWYLHLATQGCLMLAGLRTDNGNMLRWGDILSVNSLTGTSSLGMTSIGLKCGNFKTIDKAQKKPVFVVGFLNGDPNPKYEEPDVVHLLDCLCREQHGVGLTAFMADDEVRLGAANMKIIEYTSDRFGTLLEYYAMRAGYPKGKQLARHAIAHVGAARLEQLLARLLLGCVHPRLFTHVW